MVKKVLQLDEVEKKKVQLAQTTQPHLNGFKTMQDSSIY
jgi:hypothetical protein